IVDDDMLTRLIIEKYLTQHNYNAVAISSAVEGQNILTKESFDLVITDINMPEISGIDFLIWIKANSPRTKVIVMTSFSSEATKKFVSQSGAINYLEKPLDLKELDSFIAERLIDNSFSGFVRDIALFDYIKVLSFSGSTKKVSIIDPETNKTAFIYMKEGNIVHAEYADIHGEQALFKILKMENGIFTDMQWSEPSEISISVPFEELLVEAEIVTAEQTINKRLQLKEENQLIRSGNMLERVIEKDFNFIKITNIDDEKLGAFGLYIGNSDKNRVVEIMKKYSKMDVSAQIDNQLISFDDITVNVLFDDNGIIEEFNFGELYTGATYSGIAIGDSIQKAIYAYGKPRIGTIKGAVWKNIAFFSKQGTAISSIRLRRSNFFENTTQEIKLSDSERKVLEMARNRIQIPDILGIDYTIHENGSAMGIILGKTTRDQVKEIMAKYSQGFNDLRSNLVKYIYDDISTTIIFDANGIVSEMNFGILYKGATQKGLTVGSTIDKAIEIYGEPKFRNFSNSIWDNLSVFSEDSNLIDSIRIHLN
ncbi:response regulator, partial [bacterium]